MCIIAYVPAKKTLDKKIIENMFINNPDGAGIAWRANVSTPTYYTKGFTNAESVIEAFNALPKNFERALHFRIATSGKISAACCHPFPITKNVSIMKKTKGQADNIVFHNGMIHFCTPLKGMEADISDTMLFTKDYLNKLKNILHFKHIQTLIEEATNSRFLIFNKGQKALMLGHWVKDNGIYYSNTTYKQMPYFYNSCYETTTEKSEYIEIDVENYYGKKDIYETIKEAVEEKGAYIEEVLYDNDYYLNLSVVGLPKNCNSLAGLPIYRYE